MSIQKIVLVILGLAVVAGLGFAVVKTKNQNIYQSNNNPTDIPGAPIKTPTKPVEIPKKPVSTASCFVGGCSGQICSDQKDIVSTCEYRAEYACYKTAKCERQTSGQCGWTKTPALKACLSNGNAGIIY